MLKGILASLVVGLLSVSGEIAGGGGAYNGYKVYDIKVKNEDELTVLKNIEANEGEKRELDFLSFHNNVDDTVKIMVKPSEQKFVEGVFREKNLNFKTSLINVQE